MDTVLLLVIFSFVGAIFFSDIGKILAREAIICIISGLYDPNSFGLYM